MGVEVAGIHTGGRVQFRPVRFGPAASAGDSRRDRDIETLWRSDFEHLKTKLGEPNELLKVEYAIPVGAVPVLLVQVRRACEAGLPRGLVLMDAGYSVSTELRASIAALGLTYVAGILPHTTVWTSGAEPLPAKRRSGCGRPTKLFRRDAKHQPISVKELALNLPSRGWRKVIWREGSAAPLSSRACA